MDKNKLMNWDTKKELRKINETKNWFFDEIDKVNEPQVRLTRKKREATINQHENERGTSPQILQTFRS